jgi:hypothetical protein
MTKRQLLKRQEDYYKKVNEWFVSQLAKWSKKHNMHLADYGILRMWVIGTDDIHEPNQHWRDKERDEDFEDALDDYYQLIEDLSELGIDSWQGLEYSDEAQFLH